MRDILDKLNEVDGMTAIGAADINVDPEVSAAIAARALDMAAKGRNLSKIERDALKGYVELFKELISNPAFRSRLKDMNRLINKHKSEKETQPEEEPDAPKKDSE